MLVHIVLRTSASYVPLGNAARLDNARGVAAIAESEFRVGCGCGNGEFHTGERAPTTAEWYGSVADARTIVRSAAETTIVLNALVLDRAVCDALWIATDIERIAGSGDMIRNYYHPAAKSSLIRSGKMADARPQFDVIPFSAVHAHRRDSRRLQSRSATTGSRALLGESLPLSDVARRGNFGARSRESMCVVLDG
jgi:hypothetical protein